MCGGPSEAEKQAAADQRIAADLAKREAVEATAEQKRGDIGEALSARTQRKGKRGGSGRRSLFSSSAGASGFLSRF